MSMPQAEAEDLGPALAVEDALTVMVVILVLRVVLFVPMMSLDRASLDHAEKETYWEAAYGRIRSGKSAPAHFTAYDGAFDLGGKAVVVSEPEGGRLRYLEVADEDRNILVIRHDVEAQAYRSMFIQRFSNVPSFRHGRIKWSPQERKWFTLNDVADYNQDAESQDMQKRYREWREGGGRKAQ